MANQGASSSSAPFTKSWKYHVFLSFRGFDTRLNFTGHLCTALRQQGINTFMDDDELRRGEEISNALLTAIEDSKISVVVFSENYASSKWCLDELVKILDCKKLNKKGVIPVFYKVDPSDVRNQTGSFGDALAHLECKYKDNMNKVNSWRAALSQAGKLAGFTLPDEHKSEPALIQKIIQDISRDVIDSTYLHVTEYPVRMHHPVQDVTKLLDLGENDVRMVGIWGTGGIGKTTVAKVVYNSIAHEFEGSCFLENVRERSTSHEGLAKLQKTLLFEILRGTKLKVTNVDKGATMIKERLSCRKVLLVLDDVNDVEQLYKLAGACDWFGVGSRIIITTRDKQLLTAHDVSLIHEIKILDDDEAMELFSWHAFKRRGPPLGDYAELTKRAIRYAQGLPLALKVLGSCLCGGTIDKWEAALHGFKSTKIQDVLKISYNALDDDRVKEVFLDLACFFKGESRERVIEILDACDLNARYGIEVLIDKALISVGDYIRMHDLLEEMGKDIVHQESPSDAGGRSRLWSLEDIEHVLTNDTGTNKIIGIMLKSPKINYEIFLDVDCFPKMKNLRIFINYNVCISGDIGYLPNALRVLDWYRCPLQSFPPNFRPRKLVVLNMPCNNIKQPERLLKHFTKLTYLNLSGSEFLTAIPDLSASPNIKSLDASRCRSLVEVHPSVGYLDKLQVLDFSHCHELTTFPNKIRLKSLKSFRLDGCIKWESFPEIVGKMDSLYELFLNETAIKEFPASFGHLIGLKDLRLYGSLIKKLPSSIGHLTALEELHLGRTAIEELPSSIGHLTALEELNLATTAIEELPSSIGDLTALRTLSLSGCENLSNLPQSIYGLQKLTYFTLDRCPKLVTLPNNAESLPSLGFCLGMQESNLSDINSLENFCCWLNMERIDLSKSNFVSLPLCISKFVNLRELVLSGCKKLVEIVVQLPPTIGMIVVANCISLERFSTLSKILEDGDLQSIYHMDLSNCHRLCDNVGLDAAKMAKILVNNQAVNRFYNIHVVLPGSEVPESFSLPNNLFDSPIEIPWTSGLENTKLVLFIAWEITRSFTGPPFPKFSLLIDGERKIFHLDGWWSRSGHVALHYIPLRDIILPAHTKPKGGDDGKSDDQSMPSIGRIITVSCEYAHVVGLQLKSFGAHLSPISMPRDGDDGTKSCYRRINFRL